MNGLGGMPSSTGNGSGWGQPRVVVLAGQQRDETQPEGACDEWAADPEATTIGEAVEERTDGGGSVLSSGQLGSPGTAPGGSAPASPPLWEAAAGASAAEALDRRLLSARSRPGCGPDISRRSITSSISGPITSPSSGPGTAGSLAARRATHWVFGSGGRGVAPRGEGEEDEEGGRQDEDEGGDEDEDGDGDDRKGSSIEDGDSDDDDDDESSSSTLTPDPSEVTEADGFRELFDDDDVAVTSARLGRRRWASTRAMHGLEVPASSSSSHTDTDGALGTWGASRRVRRRRRRREVASAARSTLQAQLGPSRPNTCFDRSRRGDSGSDDEYQHDQRGGAGGYADGGAIGAKRGRRR